MRIKIVVEIIEEQTVNTYLSAAQEAMKEQYQTFVREQLAPVATEIEKGSVALKDFFVKMAQNGYLGLTVSKELGGQGQPFLAAVLFAEALGQQSPAAAVGFAEHMAVVELINKFGTDTQRSRYLPQLARGESIGTTAFNELTAGTDFKNVQSSAKKDGNQYAITANKTIVVNAETAGLCVTSVKEGDRLVLFVVDTNNGAFKIGKEHKLLGLHGLPVNDISFESHKLNADALLETSDATFDEQVLYAGDIAKTIVAAAALGMTETALVGAVKHANEREQFGQKIGSFQAIQWKIADMSTEMAATRMLVYRAACSKDEDVESFRKDASMAKWYAAKTARVHTGEAVQIFGVYGLYEDSMTERFYRDAKVMDLCEGTSEYQKVLIAEELGV